MYINGWINDDQRGRVHLCHIFDGYTKFGDSHFSHSVDMIAGVKMNEKLSYRRGTARRTMPFEMSSNAAQLYEKSHLKGLQ